MKNNMLNAICLFLGLCMCSNVFAQGNISVNVLAPSLFSNQATVTIDNNAKFPYVVRVLIKNKNNPDLDVASVVVTVEAQSTSKINVPAYQNLKFSDSLLWVYNYNVGDYSKKISKDPYLFPLPTSQKVIVCQSDDGPLSSHAKGEFAIDLCTSIGTPISSISDGIVFNVIDKFTEGGVDPKYYDKANLIEVLNDDGTRVLYTHLAPNSAKVKIGERVVRGQLIGEVGMTGLTSGAHLHIHLSYIDSDFQKININPEFINPEGSKYKISHGNLIFWGVDFLSISDRQLNQISVLDDNLSFKKYNFNGKDYWIEVDRDNKIKFWFVELESSSSFFKLFDETRRLGLLLPKNGGLIFLLNSEGDYVRPLYRVAYNSNNGKQTDFQFSFEHSKGMFRGYSINRKMIWLESSSSASSSFRVFNEYGRDVDSVTLSNTNGDLMLRTTFKDRKMKFSRDKGKSWHQFYDVKIIIND